MTTTLTRYRVTLPELYGPKSPGHRNRSAREGHYFRAATPHEAAQMALKLLSNYFTVVEVEGPGGAVERIQVRP